MTANLKAYLVTWRIELDADTAEGAAIKALQVQRDPQSIATIFEVKDHDGGCRSIDVNEIDIAKFSESDT